MKLRALVVLSFGLLMGADAKDDAAKKELAALKGEWKVVKAERGGQEVEQLKDAGATFTFDGDKVTVKFGEREFMGTFKVDPAKKPKEITLTVADMESRGIYKLEKDKLTICSIRGEGDERPKEFSTKEGDKAMLFTMEKAKK